MTECGYPKSFGGHGKRWLWVALMIFSFTGSNVAAQSKMSFQYGADTVYAVGNIDVDAAERLRELARKKVLPAGTVVALHSPGGSVIGGIHLGQAIRDLQLDTNVFRYAGKGIATYDKGGLDQQIEFDKNQAGECLSACIYAYLGGVRRNLYSESRLGIHQFYFLKSDAEGAAEDAQVLSAAIVAYLSKMGVSPVLFSATTLFDKNQMRYLSRQEAEDFKLVNNGVVRTKFTYRVSRGRPFPELSHETQDGKFTLGLLCNGDSVHIGASREIGQHNMLSVDKDVYYMWFDGQPVFKMDRNKDTFHHELDGAMLRKLLSSRKLRTWTEVDTEFSFDGTEFIVDDWQPFIDYLESCAE